VATYQGFNNANTKIFGSLSLVAGAFPVFAMLSAAGEANAEAGFDIATTGPGAYVFAAGLLLLVIGSFLTRNK